MIKLPTQFDARQRQHVDTAAAGGSTSTSCSSCVVTLGTTAVATSMYFSHLNGRARALKAGTAAPPVVQQPEVTPAPGEPSRDDDLLDSWWFWALWSFIALISLSMMGEGGVVTGVLTAFLFTAIYWFRVHQRAGVGLVRTILTAGLVTAVVVGAMVLEAVAWIGAL